MSTSCSTSLPNGDVIVSLAKEEKEKVDALLRKAKEFAEKHHIALGIAEMAAGAACISFGYQTGAIEMGKHILALGTGESDALAKKIGIIGGAGGAIAGAIIGGIGIAAGGGAIGIPAAIVCMGSAWIFGSSGFTAAKAIQEFVGSVNIDFGTLIAGGSLLSVGVYLLLDGAWRCLPKDKKDLIREKIKETLSMVSDYMIYLGRYSWEVIAKTAEEMANLYAAALKIMNSDKFKKAMAGLGGATTAAAGGIGGGILGGSIAASSVTVLGSEALGSLALSLGLISAPLWPVFLLGGTGVLIGGGAYWAVRKLFSSKLKNEEILAMQLLLPAPPDDSEAIG